MLSRNFLIVTLLIFLFLFPAQVAARTINAAVERLVEELLTTDMDKLGGASRRERTVVAPLSYRQGVTEFSLELQERLVTTLVQRGLPVVERSQLERILQEQQLSYSGLFNIGSAQEVGRLLGAELMLLGTINDQGNTITLNTRLVDLGTASIVAASVVELPKTPLIVQGLERIAVSPTVPTRGRVRRSEPAPTLGAATSTDGVFENEWIRLEVNSVIWDEEENVVNIVLRITNKSEKNYFLAIGDEDTDALLFDEFGEIWLRQEPVIGIRTSSGDWSGARSLIPVQWTTRNISGARTGSTFRILCPPNGSVGSIWGTNIYTTDSHLCTAAVHAGLITVREGGEVVIRFTPGQGSYAASNRNGVSSHSYGSWGSSFTFENPEKNVPTFLYAKQSIPVRLRFVSERQSMGVRFNLTTRLHRYVYKDQRWRRQEPLSSVVDGLSVQR